MILNFPIFILILWLKIFLFQNMDSTHPPLAMADGWNLKNVASKEFAFKLTDDSTLVDYKIVVLKDEHELPIAYSSYITTPVCDDTLCALMHIQVYWNLLGNYIGFDTITGLPLTKNDHLEFSSEDYTRLHRLLMDEHSIIKRKSKDELFDANKQRVSKVVDAITGATAKEVKEVVVDGALYSCYTLYHIVHGDLSDSIRLHMENHFNDSIRMNFLASSHPDYQLYILRKLTKTDFIKYQQRIINVIHLTIPLNRLYIMKKMPEEMWKIEQVQNEISRFYEDLDMNSRTFFMKEIATLDQIRHVAILNLIDDMELMSKNQMTLMIRILNKIDLSDDIIFRLNKEMRNKNFIHSNLIEDFFKNGQGEKQSKN